MEVQAFLGIPYALPPTGPLRFRPPVPVERWDGGYHPGSLPPSCPQPAARPGLWPQEPSLDEDCLALNVWTPAAGDDGRRPVMVWLHGGGFTTGSGSWPLYNGAALARRGDVVVVTVNHRLGPLGYMYLGKEFGDDFATSGNNGMLDLVCALEWVRDHIAEFGGDPGNVTIFGESGGGAKVSTLLAMPSAHGLFHRAVVQSGPLRKAIDLSTAVSLAAAAVDGRSLEELQAAPVDDLIGLGDVPIGPLSGWSPVVDGVVLPMHPGDAYSSGAAADVPVLIGSTRDEATLFLRNTDEIDDEKLVARLVRLYGDRAEPVLTLYRQSRPDASNIDLQVAIQSDAMMRIPSIRWAERWLEGQSSPLYMYLFRWAAGPLRSAHGFEIPFVFDNVRQPVMNPSPSRQWLADRMSEAWLAFARTGDPNHGLLPEWPIYTTDDRATMIFDRDDCHLELDPCASDRDAWVATRKEKQ